jgi:hypothetical protein
MNVNVHRQFAPELVGQLLREALGHVDEIDPPIDLRGPMFIGACVLMQRTLIETPQAMPLQLPDLRRNHDLRG